MNTTYIEKHYNLSVSEFEGLWEMEFKDPFNGIENISVYIKAPNSIYQAENFRDKPIVDAGPRLSEVMKKLMHKIEAYPFIWGLSGEKIVSYGYDFETDYNGSSITYVDLTEIGLREVNSYYNFFSPLESSVVDEEDFVSGKGVLVKLDIDLEKQKYINHLAIDFFTEYPIKLNSLMYQEDTSPGSPFYEVPLSKMTESSGSIILHFSTVFAKKIRLIIQQESYTMTNKDTAEVVEQARLWDYASTNSKTLYEEAASEYLNKIVMPTKSGIELHEEIIGRYKS